MKEQIEEKVKEALKMVKDPETNMDIVSEGLVEGFTPFENSIKIFVGFERSSPTCNFCRALSWTIIDKISEEIIKAVKPLGFDKVQIVEELNPKILYKEG